MAKITRWYFGPSGGSGGGEHIDPAKDLEKPVPKHFIVNSGWYIDRVEVQVAYAIGIARPVSVMVNTNGTWKIPPDRIAAIVNEIFDLRPKQIIEYLDLLRPIYKRTACYGHFGWDHPDFTWEKTNRVEELRNAADLD